MILTCPACSTKYVVKDGAIPAGGRQVRCASCKHSWHQDPEADDSSVAPETTAPAVEEGSVEAPPIVSQDYAASLDAPLAEAPIEAMPPVQDPREEPASEEQSWEAENVPAAVAPVRWEQAEQPAAPPADGGETGDDFAPFYDHEPLEKPRRGIPILLLVLLVVAALAALFWFLAPADIKARLGLAEAGGDTPLEIMVTNSDRQKLASGNELFAVSGRVINPTDRDQRVPPLRAELLDASQKRVIYSWTIAPPAATLAPGRSASFNSAEVDVPEGGSHLRVTLGGPRA